MVVPKGMVPVPQDGMGDASKRLCQASVTAHLQPGTISPKDGCACVLACRWHSRRDAGLQRVGGGRRGGEDDPW